MYIGRFAPSPTGPLHLGSLIAAVASYLEAKTHHGRWLVRIEDVDETRAVLGAPAAILEALTLHGFVWDGEVWVQSQRKAAYEHALQRLQTMDWVYPCTCTRKEIADSNPSRGIDGLVYPGTCRNLRHSAHKSAAWRIRVPEETYGCHDAIQGPIRHALAQDIGDFILKRADGLFAYQLAVVVDDAEQGITHVVRGADLLDSTPRQLFLQQCLDYPSPQYMHVPVATNALGEKLSKQTLATPLSLSSPHWNLWQALQFLNQSPPDTLKHSHVDTLWAWAIAHWDASNIPAQRGIPLLVAPNEGR